MTRLASDNLNFTYRYLDFVVVDKLKRMVFITVDH